MRRVAALLLFLAASAARAQEPVTLPPAEVGLLGVSAGVRFMPQGAMESAALKAGRPLLSRSLPPPALQVSSAWRVDREWSVYFEGGWGLDNYAFGDGSTLGMQTINLQLGGQRSFDFGWQRVEPYLGVGFGYWLSTATTKVEGEQKKSLEAHASGISLTAGLRYALTSEWGLAIENRFGFAAAGVAPFGAVTVGGNTLALGLWYVWR